MRQLYQLGANRIFPYVASDSDERFFTTQCMVVEAALPEPPGRVHPACDRRETSFEEPDQIHEVAILHKNVNVVWHNTPGV